MTVFYNENDIAVSRFVENVRNEIRIAPDVLVFDTTLRDGEQTPGVALIPQGKLRIAIALDELGVNTIEAGFPITSDGEKEGIKLITNQGLRAKICGLARANKKDIDAAISCGVGCVHTFIATSDIHMKHKLKMTQEQVIEHAMNAIEYAKDHGLVVEFSAEDATRSSIDFLKTVHTKVQEVHVDRINVPDTVGVMNPRAMYWLISELKKVTKVPMSVHCHNDFGLATANTLAALEAGCDQFHSTINGLGERAGNASFEEIVMSLIAIYKKKMNINIQKICETSELVSRLMGVPIQPNKAIVGQNAFSHESGIHVHGILGESHTYEAITPEMVGKKRSIVLGKHTGVHAIKSALDEMNITTSSEQLNEITSRIKKLGDWGKTVIIDDLRAITEEVLGRISKHERSVELDELTVVTGNKVTPIASVKLKIGEDIKIGSKVGVGPVDAALNAIQSVLTGVEDLELHEYRLETITGGSNALAEVTVRLKDKDSTIYTGRSVQPDIVMASVNAMIEGLNRAATKWKIK